MSSDPSDNESGDDAVDEVAITATMHFYRAEVDRMATWRSRLDQTTNWTVVVIAAILTWAFSSPDNPHYVLLIGMLTTGAFLLIETQRYQQYDAWRSRVRLLQANFFADAFVPGEHNVDDWRQRLSRDLREPSLPMPFRVAVGHRLQRVYFPLLTVLVAAWAARITVFARELPWHRTASVAFVPGPVVVAGVGVAYLALAGVTAWSFGEAAKREFEPETPTHTPEEQR